MILIDWLERMPTARKKLGIMKKNMSMKYKRSKAISYQNRKNKWKTIQNTKTT